MPIPRGSTVFADRHVEVEFDVDYLAPRPMGRRATKMREITPEGSPTKAYKKRKKNPPDTALPIFTPPDPDVRGESTTGGVAPETLERENEYGQESVHPSAGFDSDTESVFREGITIPPTGLRNSEGKSTHEYMESWLNNHCESYLATILESEGRCASVCEVCGTGAVETRCLDCMCVPRLCRSCCRATHRMNPLHRVESWVGDRWQSSWLWHVGSVVCLGHGTSPCPYYSKSRSEVEEMVIRLGCLDTHNAKTFHDDPSFGAMPEKGAMGGGLMITIAHTNGFHKLPLFPCFCPTSPQLHLQLLRAGLYPATSTDPQTVFTVQLLKHFHLSKVDSHLSVEHYCSLLRRMTNYIFPEHTPERRRELTRVWQQYDHLTDLKRNGFGIINIRLQVPGKGSMALFCAVCPQAGVNLPDNWMELEDSWRFWRYLTTDGNFVLDHLELLGPDVAVWLSNGARFFANRDQFYRFLLSVGAHEKKEDLTCNQLRAVADKNKLKRGYDSTGVVASACARHGCFAPSSVCDMQKGEKQANGDYSIAQAYETTNAKALLGLRHAYDVNCQFCVRFRERFESQFLRGVIPPEATVLFLIGLFHVHGHKEECLARFAPTFAPGSGMAAGEVLESLWAGIIGAAAMTRTMTAAHRVAVLDAIMQDSNWKKLQGMVKWLVKELRRGRKGLLAAENDYARLNKTRRCTPALRKRWETQMKEAHDERLKGNVSAMDIYNTAVFEADCQKEVQLRLMSEERKQKTRRGIAEWMGLGIRIQELQLELRAYIKDTRSDEKRGAVGIETEKKRAALLTKVEEYFEKGRELFDGLELESLEVAEVAERNLCICEDALNYCNCENELAVPEEESVRRKRTTAKSKKLEVDVEWMRIPLPSTVVTRPVRWESEVKKEVDLRVAQAHEALEAMRGYIAHKSYLYRTNKKLARGKRGRKSKYGEINSVEKTMRLEAKRYDLARWALARLGAIGEHPELEELRSKDTKAVISVWDPNAAGRRDSELPWIWKLRHSKGTKSAKDYVTDLYRVNWIRARSRRDRWREEKTLLESEMEWFVRFCKSRRERALAWASEAVTEGHSAYAFRQADMWGRLGRQAKVAFKKSGVIVDVLLGDEGDGCDEGNLQASKIDNGEELNTEEAAEDEEDSLLDPPDESRGTGDVSGDSFEDEEWEDHGVHGGEGVDGTDDDEKDRGTEKS